MLHLRQAQPVCLRSHTGLASVRLAAHPCVDKPFCRRTLLASVSPAYAAGLQRPAGTTCAHGTSKTTRDHHISRYEKLAAPLLGVVAAMLLAMAPVAHAELSTVPAAEITAAAKPLPKQKPNKERIWLLLVLGASSLFGVTVLAENNTQFFPAIARANKALAASRKRAEEQEKLTQQGGTAVPPPPTTTATEFPTQFPPQLTPPASPVEDAEELQRLTSSVTAGLADASRRVATGGTAATFVKADVLAPASQQPPAAAPAAASDAASAPAIAPEAAATVVEAVDAVPAAEEAPSAACAADTAAAGEATGVAPAAKEAPAAVDTAAAAPATAPDVSAASGSQQEGAGGAREGKAEGAEEGSSGDGSGYLVVTDAGAGGLQPQGDSRADKGVKVAAPEPQQNRAAVQQLEQSLVAKED